MVQIKGETMRYLRKFVTTEENSETRRLQEYNIKNLRKLNKNKILKKIGRFKKKSKFKKVYISKVLKYVTIFRY